MSLTKEEFFRESLYNELIYNLVRSDKKFSEINWYEFTKIVSDSVISFCTQQGREF